ncbi:MAG TPA: class I SAM-dependent methyltransferase [Dehalococcoidia bacterium]
MRDENRQAWNRRARKYQAEAGSSLPTDRIHYASPAFPYDDELGLVGDVGGRDVLEIGCGAAQCGIAMAKQGARVTGLDLSEEQLACARELAAREGVSLRLVHGSMEDLSAFADASFDLVFSACALGYVADWAAVCREAGRVLRPGGAFVFSTSHPVFQVVANRELWHDPTYPTSYFARGPLRWEWDEGSGVWFTEYKRTLGDLLNPLAAAGLLLERLEEPQPVRPAAEDPYWDAEQLALARELPLLLIVKARRPG